MYCYNLITRSSQFCDNSVDAVMKDSGFASYQLLELILTTVSTLLSEPFLFNAFENP